MKRLLCIVSAMNAGGAETFLMKIYRKLDRSLYQMDFCVNITEKGFYDDEIYSLGGRIYHIPAKSQSPLQFEKQLKTIIEENAYEYVMRITSNTMGFWDLKIAKQAGAKVCIARSSNSSDGGSFSSKVAHFAGKLLFLKYVDIKIAPSDLAARYTFGDSAYENGDVIVLRNAIDLSNYAYSDDLRKKIRNDFNIPMDAVVLGHIGRFSKQKNHKKLLDIFYSYQKIVPNSRLLLVGQGELQDSVKNQAVTFGIMDKVIFAGVRSDVQALLSAMDVFVFPSLYEGMPNTIIEAQANGLPCILSDTITKEANVSGHLCYRSLDLNSEKWADDIASHAEECRYNARDKMTNSGYSIDTMVPLFVKTVFENGSN